MANIFKSEAVPYEIGGEKFKLVFDLNVMAEVCESYPSIDDICDATTTASGIKKILTILINNAIEIENEKNEKECHREPINEKWVGRNILAKDMKRAGAVIVKAFVAAMPESEDDTEKK